MEKLTYLSASNHLKNNYLSTQNTKISIQCHLCNKPFLKTNTIQFNNKHLERFNNHCPECNLDGNQYYIKNTESTLKDFTNKEDNDMVLNRQIKCINEGCNEFINKRDLNNHILKCIYRSIYCKNCLCITTIKELSTHEEKECNRTKKKCKCEKEYELDKYKNHIKNCTVYNKRIYDSNNHICKNNRICNDCRRLGCKKCLIFDFSGSIFFLIIPYIWSKHVYVKCVENKLNKFKIYVITSFTFILFSLIWIFSLILSIFFLIFEMTICSSKHRTCNKYISSGLLNCLPV